MPICEPISFSPKKRKGFIHGHENRELESEKKQKLEFWVCAVLRTLHSFRSMGAILLLIKVGVDGRNKKRARRAEKTKQ